MSAPSSIKYKLMFYAAKSLAHKLQTDPGAAQIIADHLGVTPQVVRKEFDEIMAASPDPDAASTNERKDQVAENPPIYRHAGTGGTAYRSARRFRPHIGD